MVRGDEGGALVSSELERQGHPGHISPSKARLGGHSMSTLLLFKAWPGAVHANGAHASLANGRRVHAAPNCLPWSQEEQPHLVPRQIPSCGSDRESFPANNESSQQRNKGRKKSQGEVFGNDETWFRSHRGKHSPGDHFSGVTLKRSVWQTVWKTTGL